MPTEGRVIDLRSDTVTRPGPAMRAAIAEAAVGDDQYGDDPTVNELQERVAALLGKESALFFPTGIMANETAIVVHGSPGTEAVVEASCHLFDWEGAAAAAWAGVQLHPVATDDGVLTADLVRSAIRPAGNRYQPATSLICVENTHNAHGGRVIPLSALQEVHAVAAEHGLPVHLDGARLWHASVATGVRLVDYAATADSVMVALSKGLGCPVGSMLAGSAAFIDAAWQVRRRMGGSLRQTGILAAAGLFALDNNIQRLAHDHRRARALAAVAARIEGLHTVEPDSNIVMIDLVRDDLQATDVLAALAQRGVLMSMFAPRRVRAVTHMDVDDDAIAAAGEALRAVLVAA